MQKGVHDTLAQINTVAYELNREMLSSLSQTFHHSVILHYDETLPRLRLLFSDNQVDDAVCSASAEDDVNVQARIFCKIQRPLTDHRLIKKTAVLGEGMYGIVFQGAMDHLFEKVDPRLVGREVVVKQSKVNDRTNAYRDTLHELLVEQGALREQVLTKGLPNFAMLYTYIVCKPRPFSSNEPLCTDDIIDLSAIALEELNEQLAKGELQLFGVYEKVNGTQLDAYIEHNPDDFGTLVNNLTQIFLALNEVNQNGNRFTHCDLSARNVMISPEIRSEFTYHNRFVLTPAPAHRAVIIDYGKSAAKFEFGDQSFVVVNHDNFFPATDILYLLRDLLIVIDSVCGGKMTPCRVFIQTLLNELFGPWVLNYFSMFPQDDDVIAFRYSLYLLNVVGMTQTDLTALQSGWTYMSAALQTQAVTKQVLQHFPNIAAPSVLSIRA